MKNILPVCLFVLLGLACSTTQSKNVESNNTPQNIRENPTPPPAANTDDAFNKLKEANRTTTPASNQNQNPIRDADYTVTRLVQSKMTQTTLDKQPQKIIEQILTGESTEKDKWRSPKNIKAKIEDRDFNQDGSPERIIISKLYSEAGVPVLYLFSSENGIIFQRDLDIPDGDADIDVEFLAKPGTTDFDLIKITENLGGEEAVKEITYYKMLDNRYEPSECHKIEGKTDRVIPCQM